MIEKIISPHYVVETGFEDDHSSHNKNIQGFLPQLKYFSTQQSWVKVNLTKYLIDQLCPTIGKLRVLPLSKQQKAV